MAAQLGREKLAVRIMTDQDSAPLVTREPDLGRIVVSIEADPYAYRGTGGLIRDLAVEFDDDQYLLVINGFQILVEDLGAIAAELAAKRSDVTIVGHLDGTPSGVLLGRCGPLKSIPESGYVDMKEQALPSLAQRSKVLVASREAPTGLPIRTLSDYMSALRLFHGRALGRDGEGDPFAENLTPLFSIIEDDADVEPSATIQDTVVLGGATVEGRSVVARSLVCPGARVRAGQRVADRLIVGQSEKPGSERYT
ncbi:MAG: hypothetical protein OER86_04110 [Phycisphaerae bacterium]|nr:hypothetical protein [Phycisphaerae bacterium]